MVATVAPARADIFQWEYVNPADPGQGKQQSMVLTPGGAGVDAVPGADLYGQDLTMAYLIGKDLLGASAWYVNLTDADLSQANLTNAYFSGVTFTGAEFTDARVQGARFHGGTYFGGTGLTLSQLYSTANYQAHDLTRIDLGGNNLSGGNFAGQNLTNAGFGYATLTGADFTGAQVQGANFLRGYDGGGTGLTLAQLYSTASYQAHDLTGIGLGGSNLSGGNFAGQNLTNAGFFAADLTGANLSQANLTNARLGGFSCPDACWAPGAILTNANLAGAVITGAGFYASTWNGFTKEQLYSTASYQQRNLGGIGLSANDLTAWDFSGQDLTGANFSYSTLTNANLSRTNLTGADFLGSSLTNANFSFADLRGAVMPSEPIQLARNTIREFGAINGLDLQAGETLVVRDSNIGITVNDSMNAVSGGTLELVLADAEWGSTMAVAAGVTPDLGGTLRVRFADQTSLASMLGATFDFFDWPAVLETNNRFDAIELPPGTQWDLNQLYVTGTAQLMAIPEPSAVLLFTCGAAACAVARLHCRPPCQCPPAFS